MIGTFRIEHQAIVVVCSIDPCLGQGLDIDRQHAILLIRNIGEVCNTAIEIPTRRKPRLPGNGTLIPTGSNAIKVSGLARFIVSFIQVKSCAGDRRIRWNRAQIKPEQASAVCAVIWPHFKGSIASKVRSG